MNSRYRRWFFDHYWRIIISVVVILVLLVMNGGSAKSWEYSISIIGSGIAVLFFIQKQKLAEIKLFDKLFNRFNKGYSELHRDMQRIASVSEDAVLTLSDAEILDKYFNLCGEEYLFYSQGRILPEAWDAWRAGMNFYLSVPRISSFWDGQELTNSHYGLTRAIMENRPQ